MLTIPEMLDGVQQAGRVAQADHTNLACSQALNEIVHSNIGRRAGKHFLASPRTLSNELHDSGGLACAWRAACVQHDKVS